MTTMRLDIEYDGTNYFGWAAQNGRRTVQDELQRALSILLRQPVRLAAAGRTDSGVHAWGQVASFDTEAEIPGDLLRRLNSITARDVSVTAASPVPAGFDARASARSRTYCYRLLIRPMSSPFEEKRALWFPYRFDLDRLDACAAAVLGKHDFTAFTPTQTDHVHFHRRVLRAEWVTESETELRFWVEADSFMRSMVRVIVGTILEVSTARRTVDDFTGLLDGAPREQAGETAPAHGLYLASVSF